MEKILIIDDDIDIAELESYLLKKEGFETVICNSGEEALDIIDKERYDLILMDIMMPGISGIELCAKIREKVDCSIIFVTAKANIVDKIIGFVINNSYNLGSIWNESTYPATRLFKSPLHFGHFTFEERIFFMYSNSLPHTLHTGLPKGYFTSYLTVP